MTDDAHKLPPRDGLIPGTWRMIDPARLGGVVDRPRAPKRWSMRHVGMRLIEAHRTLKRLPMNTRPASMKTAWPMHEVEPIEGAVEEGGVKVDPTSVEIGLMEQAIGWPMQFLSSEPAKASDVNLWASQVKVEEFEKVEDASKAVPWEALGIIARALNAAMEQVR